MKKANRNSRIDDLLIDVIEYAFTEWLVRRGIFVAFKSNYKRAFTPWKSFRDRLRSHIRHSLQNSSFGPSRLISSAFLFTLAPEGVKFWATQQAAWERFYAKFQTNL